MEDSNRPVSSRLPGAVAIGVLVAVGAYVSMFLLAPSARPRLATEDGVIEAATAALFLGAAAVGSVGVLRTGATRIHWLIPLVGLLGFLDEMRFGARIFGFSPPSVNEVEVDSFHDVLTVADRLASDLGLTRGRVALLALAVALVVTAYLFKSDRLKRIPTWLAEHRPIALMLGALGLIMAGVVLDQLGSTSTIVFAEETVEFAASGLVAIAATDIICQDDAVSSVDRLG